MSINDRLDLIENKISSEDFRKNIGSANEVGYYVFDYEPKEELIVRKYIDQLVEEINQKDYLDFHIKKFDLYDILLQYIKEEDILETIFEIEEDEGFHEVSESIKDGMGIDTLDDNYLIKHIQNNIDNNSIVFITGLGKVYPIIRAHKVLNNLHLVIDNVPVILFLPGMYSGLEIKLFGSLTTNYYRAFKLID